MLATKLQVPTSRMALRYLQPRSVRNSITSIRTFRYKGSVPQQKPYQHRNRPPITYPVKAKSSPRVHSPPQRARDDFLSGNKPSEVDVSPLEAIGAIVFLLVARIVVETIFSFVAEKLGFTRTSREQKLVSRDAVDLMGKENAEWFDWYVREGAGEKKEREESKR